MLLLLGLHSTHARLRTALSGVQTYTTTNHNELQAAHALRSFMGWGNARAGKYRDGTLVQGSDAALREQLLVDGACSDETTSELVPRCSLVHRLNDVERDSLRNAP
eukprot:SAG11_NODE_50_length_19992_cov_9.945157_4_plen_106_part_00